MYYFEDVLNLLTEFWDCPIKESVQGQDSLNFKKNHSIYERFSCKTKSKRKKCDK